MGEFGLVRRAKVDAEGLDLPESDHAAFGVAPVVALEATEDLFVLLEESKLVFQLHNVLAEIRLDGAGDGVGGQEAEDTPTPAAGVPVEGNVLRHELGLLLLELLPIGEGVAHLHQHIPLDPAHDFLFAVAAGNLPVLGVDPGNAQAGVKALPRNSTSHGVSIPHGAEIIPVALPENAVPRRIGVPAVPVPEEGETHCDGARFHGRGWGRY